MPLLARCTPRRQAPLSPCTQHACRPSKEPWPQTNNSLPTNRADAPLTPQMPLLQANVHYTKSPKIQRKYNGNPPSTSNTKRPSCNQIHNHNPKSTKSNENPPSTSKNPLPKSPKQTRGASAEQTSTSRTLEMVDDIKQLNRRGGGDAQRRRAEMGRSGAVRSLATRSRDGARRGCW